MQPMNSREFFDKVCLMRRLQREYFKTRNRSVLEQSKQVEREIDKEIERVQKRLGIAIPSYTQKTLFGDGAE